MDRPQNRIALLATTGVGLLGALALTARVLRPRGDDSLPLPGDDLVPGATIVETHQARIDAPAAEVWPWLVQMGYGRGGFYSFDLLERLAGVGITNARRIESRWQDLAVGDRVRLAADVALTVARLEPGPVCDLDFTFPQTDRRVPGARALPRPVLRRRGRAVRGGHGLRLLLGLRPRRARRPRFRSLPPADPGALPAPPGCDHGGGASGAPRRPAHDPRDGAGPAQARAGMRPPWAHGAAGPQEGYSAGGGAGRPGVGVAVREIAG